MCNAFADTLAVDTCSLVSGRWVVCIGWMFTLLCVIQISFLLPARVRLLRCIFVYFSDCAAECFDLWFSISMLVLAHQYSAPPLLLNHRALGEVVAAVVMNVLLPLFAIVLQFSDGDLCTASPIIQQRVLLIVIPPSLIKFATFVVLNLNDRRPDWLGRKITLPLLMVLFAVQSVSILTTVCTMNRLILIPQFFIALQCFSPISRLFILEPGSFSRKTTWIDGVLFPPPESLSLSFDSMFAGWKRICILLWQSCQLP